MSARASTSPNVKPPPGDRPWFRRPPTATELLATAALLLALALPLWGWYQGSGAARVVAYVAQDQVYAEPLLARFTRETGIRVAAVYDSEAVKTVGLANRLLAERQRPQCDVFWGNEELRTRQLAAQGVWRDTNGWQAFGYRSRRIAINANFVKGPDAAVTAPRTSLDGAAPDVRDRPALHSLRELTNAVWRGKVALAYPLFGTTATHFLALRQAWGESAWEAWCRALAANQPLVVDGNSVVAKLVARGEAWVGLTDSDDIAAVQRDGAPVRALPLDQDALLIPNTVAMTRSAPHPTAAEALFRFLQQPGLGEALVEAGALEGATPDREAQVTLAPDWPRLLAELEPATRRLKEIFLR
jgi:iron(III) transport system substrate-binding protein